MLNMEIINQAIEKIKEEMEKNKNPYMTIIGNYVLSNLEVNKPSAEKIVNREVTLSGSLKEMEKEARKVAVNGVGVLTDEQGLEIVSKYFGFEGVQIDTYAATKEDHKSNVINIADKKKDIFNLDIDSMF